MKDENISKESMQDFIKCLEKCNSNPLNLENYEDINDLAEKYQISWLKKECENFFPIFCCAAAIQKRFPNVIKSYVRKELPELKVSSSTKQILDHLADEYQLFDLKLFSNDIPFKVNQNDALEISGSELDDEN